MSIVYKFRLTKVLHDQIRATGRTPAAVLSRWDDTDYTYLCEYVTQCRKVVPKFIGKLAEHLGESPRSLIRQIVQARAELTEGMAQDGDLPGYDAAGLVYLPEDKTDRANLLAKICGTQTPYS